MGSIMFFKSKKKTAEQAQLDDAAALKDELDAAIVPEIKEASDAAETVATAAAEGTVVENIRLFAGFEDQAFEIGYASYANPELGLTHVEPMLVMRWKAAEGDAAWFPVPAVFNKVLLARIHEREDDLDRLLLDYGYDADQLTTARPSQD